MDTAPARVADRFAIEGEAGQGGMGTVFRAIDAVTGRRVALKLMRELSPEDAERFARESSVLAELSHPGIVGYVAHGVSAGRQPYLAMDWLEGETLEVLLRRRRLAPDELAGLLGRAAEALAHAHDRRVLHRDIKPSNLFLVAGDPDRVTLLDFGVARWIDDRHLITSTGALIGTPSYMAPEQARGSRELDPRADVFALGCVAYRCLTGVSPFEGENLLSTLFRILFEDPPPPRERNPEVPAALDQLVCRMLSKDLDRRPRDARAVVRALEAPASESSSAITGVERHIVSLVLVRPTENDWLRGSPEDERLRAVASENAGHLERVAGGSALILFAGTGAASDHARRAARCALEVRSVLPDAVIAVASGMAGPMPVGDVIERVVQGTERIPSGRIQIDEATAGLLDGSFVLVAGPGGGQQLRAAGDAAILARTVLGKATPIVGRERELAMLEAIGSECATDSVARAVIVTGAAGIGKSRLRQELVRRVVRANQKVEVLLGRGDPLRTGVPFALLGDALRRTAGIVPSDAAAEQHDKLSARVARHVPAAAQPRVATFLGAMLGLELPGSVDDTIRAARADHLLRYDQMRVAWLTWLEAEATDHPVLLALEDLHWGDQPTVDFVDAALGHLAERPLLVVALARPELRARFPELWDRRDPQEVRLSPLQSKASQALVRDLLGDEMTDAEVARIVDHSTGNPLFLEELVRAQAEGTTGALPDSVLLMLQARLVGLDPELRRVLRAASVFGETFSADGVQALLGSDRDLGWVTARLGELRGAELVVQRSAAVDHDETTRPVALFAFRHALVRDAAHATFTDADRAVGHRLAAEWLERRGDSEPAVLAEHFARGGQPERAVAWLRVGAEAALAGSDLCAAIDLADRGLQLGASGVVAGVLHRIRAEAHNWRGEPEESVRAAELAMDLLERGSADWFTATDELFMTAGRLRRFDLSRAVLMAAFQVEPRDQAALHSKISFLARAVIVMVRFGSPAIAETAIEALRGVAGDPARLPCAVAARLHTVYGLLARTNGDADRCFAEHEAGLAALEGIQDHRTLCYHLANEAGLWGELGDLVEAERAARRAMAESHRLELPVVIHLSEYAVGTILARTGAVDEAIPLLERVLASNRSSKQTGMAGMAGISLGEALTRAGELERARSVLEDAMIALADAPDARANALVWLARVALGRGDLSVARQHAAAAVTLMPCHDGIQVGESAVRAIEIEVLEQIGELEQARERLGAALERLTFRTGRLQPRWRNGFLAGVEEHRFLLARAAALAVPLPALLAEALR